MKGLSAYARAQCQRYASNWFAANPASGNWDATIVRVRLSTTTCDEYASGWTELTSTGYVEVTINKNWMYDWPQSHAVEPDMDHGAYLNNTVVFPLNTSGSTWDDVVQIGVWGTPAFTGSSLIYGAEPSTAIQVENNQRLVLLSETDTTTGEPGLITWIRTP